VQAVIFAGVSYQYQTKGGQQKRPKNNTDRFKEKEEMKKKGEKLTCFPSQSWQFSHHSHGGGVHRWP